YWREAPRDGIRLTTSHGPVSRSDAPRAHRGREEDRPHGHGHPQHLRPPDALRSRPRLSAGDYEAAAPEVDHSRADLVPERGHEHRLPEGERGLNLGRMGGRERRPRARLWETMALLGHARWPHDRPDRRSS